MCIWLFQRIAAVRFLLNWFLIRWMEKYNCWACDKRSVSLCNILLFITTRCSISHNRYVKVSGNLCFLFRLYSIPVFYRYKPLIVVSACFGIVISSLLLWTESLGALQVKNYGNHLNIQFLIDQLRDHSFFTLSNLSKSDTAKNILFCL